MRRFGLIAALLLAAATAGAAPSPLVAELEVVATRYHENPHRLDALRDGLERAVRGDPHTADLVALARVSFIWGDIRATTAEQKLEAYDRGRQAAGRAIERALRNAAARFWFATNTARVPGLLGGDLGKAEAMFRKGLEQDPKFTGQRVGLGKTLIKTGRIAEARDQLQAVLDAIRGSS